MFNFSDRQLSDTLANFLYLCQPRPCPSNWPEHWQSPINPPPYDHNLFCSLVLKHERKQKSRICLGIPMFTTWVKNSSLGSRKIKFITWVNPSSEYSFTWVIFITWVRTNIYGVSQMILQFSFLFYHAHAKNSVLSITGSV